MQALLITDCLQNDFVGPIAKFQGLPNALHVGHDESLRLLGPNPAEGPVARAVAWAHAQPDTAVKVIHVRDWHDPNDAQQKGHLEQFGKHCVRDTQGAEFVFNTDDIAPGKEVDVVDATILSNFVGARLGEAIAPYTGKQVRVGLMGVWTEAKITFLAYDLRARHPDFQIAVCSALTASSSRQNHFVALDQLERILGVRVLDSVGEFIEFLGGTMDDAPLIGFSEKHPVLKAGEKTNLSETDEQLVRYLFRGCREVAVQSLDGGFSGNAVLATRSVDLHGHEQVAHVVKVGAKGPIGQERTAFERIEAVLGNAAPRIVDFADLKDRGALKYRYAAMGGGPSRSFQKLYASGIADEDIRRILDQIFVEQLGRLYRAAEPEQCDLFDYYQFSPRWAPSVRAKVADLVGAAGNGEVLEFPGGRRVQNVTAFYEKALATLPRVPRSHYQAHLHGDLNGANIIVDGQSNVWLIDFFHSHRGHVLKDLAKFENDLLYIWTTLENEGELEQALALSDALLSVEDLGAPLRDLDHARVRAPHLRRAWRTIQHLRSYYADLIKKDREPYQLLIPQLRYAVHTLGFEESLALQKRWALYTASAAASRLRRRFSTGALRVDWLADRLAQPGRVGLTWLPGRKDAGRDVDADIARIKEEGITGVVCLLAKDEFTRYGVDDLLDRYREAGLEVHHAPTVDGWVPTDEELRAAVKWVESKRVQGGKVLIHCVGGLGRAGTIAACWLRSHGQSAAEAIAAVRQARSPRAIETMIQEQAIDRFRHQ